MLEQSAQRFGKLRQFSLRSLFVLMTVVCLASALVAMPFFLVLAVAIMLVAIFGGFVIVIWQGKGWAKAFSIGAIIPHGCCFLGPLNARDVGDALFFVVALELMALVAGVGAAAFHGYLNRRNGYLPIPNLPFIRHWFSND